MVVGQLRMFLRKGFPTGDITEEQKVIRVEDLAPVYVKVEGVLHSVDITIENEMLIITPAFKLNFRSKE